MPATKAKILKALMVATSLLPWLLSMYIFYWLDSSGTWTSETPHRGKLSIAILAAGMALSFVLYWRLAAIPHEATRPYRTYARNLFAEIAVRIVAYGADMVVVLFVMIFLDEYVFNFIGLHDELRTATWVLALMVYFAAFWISPLQATPMQFLFRMQVLHASGSRLVLRDAAIRSVVLVAQWGLALFLLKQFSVPGMWLSLVVVSLLFYLPSVTAYRQGLHDLLAHSVVINRHAVRSADDERRMREFLAHQDPAIRRSSRPSIAKMIMDAVALAVPLLLMNIGIGVANQKNMHARMAYAMHETLETRQIVETWFEASGDWPSTEAELGRPLRHNYPAGGFYQLEDGGVIRIQFEIRPELRNGSILFEAEVQDAEVNWKCRVVGNIEQRYVPASCR